MGIKLGDAVKQKVHVIEGVVVAKEFNQESDSFIYKVAYKGPDGQHHESAFSEHMIELRAPVEAEVADPAQPTDKE